MKKKWTIQILCMLGILLMFSSCYHRRAHHQMHAAMVEYSNKQLDSISFYHPSLYQQIQFSGIQGFPGIDCTTA